MYGCKFVFDDAGSRTVCAEIRLPQSPAGNGIFDGRGNRVSVHAAECMALCRVFIYSGGNRRNNECKYEYSCRYRGKAVEKAHDVRYARAVECGLFSGSRLVQYTGQTGFVGNADCDFALQRDFCHNALFWQIFSAV